MATYCRSCLAGFDEPDATEESLCDDCAGALTHLGRVARDWCDPDDETDSAELRRAIRHAQDMGFESSEIADVGAAECAAMGLAAEFRDFVACIHLA